LPTGKDGPEAASLLIVPPVFAKERYLVFPGIVRLDMKTGEVAAKEMRDAIPMGHGSEVFFIRQDRTGDGKNVYAIGKIDAEKLEETVLLELKGEEHGELMGHMAISPDGSRFAVAREKEDEVALLILRGKEVEQTIVLGPRKGVGEPGNLEWSAVTGAIHAAFAKPVEGKGLELGVLEVPLDGSPQRKTTLLSTPEHDDDKQILLFQIALSPDGKTLAVPSTYVDKIAKEDAALFLMDLSSPDRKVTKVPLLAPEKKN
jgi:hypothetical protein